MGVPNPPMHPRPRVTTWPAGRTFSRIHELRYDATQFNSQLQATIKGRFHFFDDANGRVVTVLYGSETIDGAIAEVLFRNVPVRGAERFIRSHTLSGLGVSVITPKRDLTLIELFGHGLRRLGVTAEELTSTDSTDYARTVAWAQRLYESVHRADGLVWMSRQFNAAQALMLFGDRIQQTELDGGMPLELYLGEGLELVSAAANAAEITITT